MMTSFIENLAAAVAENGPLCVGLDPRMECLPAAFREQRPDVAFNNFCHRVLLLVRPYCGVVKFQSAFFEQIGDNGFHVLRQLMRVARGLGFRTILDSKRGDIASTATAYAKAAFDIFDADAVTVNPYLGSDAVEPFLTEARKTGRGVFVLVRTSNPGSGTFQNLNCDDRPLYRHVAEKVVEWNNAFGNVGAVVGATHPEELKELRAAMPNVWFLVPGYGAQGGTAADVKAAFPLAVVNSSRGVTFPFQPDDADWEAKITAAAAKAANELKIA